VLAKILYVSPAWWGFANSSDKQRLEAFLRRCIRLHFRQEVPTVTELVEDLGEQLFTDVLVRMNVTTARKTFVVDDMNLHCNNRRCQKVFTLQGRLLTDF